MKGRGNKGEHEKKRRTGESGPLKSSQKKERPLTFISKAKFLVRGRGGMGTQMQQYARHAE